MVCGGITGRLEVAQVLISILGLEKIVSIKNLSIGFNNLTLKVYDK